MCEGECVYLFRRSSPSMTPGQGSYYPQQYGNMQQPLRGSHPGGMLNPTSAGFTRSPVMYRPGPAGGNQQVCDVCVCVYLCVCVREWII